MTSDSWPLLTLEEAGITLYDCVHDTPKSTESGYPWISIPEMKNGFLDYASARTISEEDFTKWTKGILPQKNDVVISRRTNPGVHAPVLDDTPFALGQNLVILRSDGTKVLPEFLRILIASFHWDNQVFSFINTGAVFESLTCYDIQKKMRLPIPSKYIQRRLIEILNPVDEAMRLQAPISDNLQYLISSLFRSWFIDFDPVKAKAEGKLPYGMDEETAALFPDAFEDSELGPIPSGWSIGTIHDIAKQRKDIAKPDVFNEMLPYIGLEHMPRNSIALTKWGVSEGLESNKFRYSKKDILFGKLRPYFHKVGPAPLEGVCSTDILVIQPIDEELGGILLPILSSEHFVNFVSGISEGVGLPRTKWEHFKLYKIALPPVEIRAKFVSLVDPMLQIIESSIHESKSLEHARDALLPRLMSGELKVN